ncbi:XXYS1_4_G0030900.mRNA.1.CDS.1 [Saccharomyces cerevisiae]|nr:EM14S01-3B_G0028370.mRNA.1.CDS.1 [Saccharomyces cerevisiae]CAD6647370.1 XXYS1_4_G0030900.mRNA.1.CDS.1 [Saccharomyces cerevisiae]CAI4786199.1 CEI_1a_G0050130.mRNA.1.CDS.1 [Saccharomyces cerevisiae]CAI4793581.1 AMH_1a_G0050230.mRNA.1.CDS.1 [Saccharomyces cerevisiae]CAI6883542.1 AMH_1a_G0050230.mRNA.1.CDS.1 [Saccharomyces cerevisiae]
MSNKVKTKAMVPPINCIFNFLQQQTPVTIWLFEQIGIRIKGKIVGFDEFMNVVIDEAVEIPVNSTDGKEDVEKGTPLGKILLKGDNITLITSAD